MKNKQRILIKTRLILGIACLFILASCAVFRKSSKDENQTKDGKRKNKVEKYQNTCYFLYKSEPDKNNQG